MGAMSRRKGQCGERELAAWFREEGLFEGAHRGRQYKGGQDSPDVGGTPGFHFEVKRTETLRLHEALAQCLDDCPPGCLPVVAHRRNRGEWVFVLPASVFAELLRRSTEKGEPNERPTPAAP